MFSAAGTRPIDAIRFVQAKLLGPALHSLVADVSRPKGLGPGHPGPLPLCLVGHRGGLEDGFAFSETINTPPKGRRMRVASFIIIAKSKMSEEHLCFHLSPCLTMGEGCPAPLSQGGRASQLPGCVETKTDKTDNTEQSKTAQEHSTTPTAA